MADLNITESLTYASPMIETSGKINYISYKPSGAQSFSAGDSFTIKLSSNTDFIDLGRSYMKYKINVSLTTGNLNPIGGEAIFNSVQDQIGGLQIPVSRNWHLQRGVQLTTDTYERQSITAQTEFFTGTGTGVACTAGSFSIVCPPVTSVVTDKMIPLALLNAGHQITYTLNPAANVVSTGTYTVSDVEFVTASVTPEPAYLEEISRGLGSGNALKIPVSLYKSITSSLTATNTQDLNLQIGYLSSINSVTLVQKAVANVLQNANQLKEYYIQIDGARYPKNKTITNGAESLYQVLAGYSTKLSSIAIYNSTQPFQQYTFKSNSQFGSGIASANGALTLSLDFTGNVPLSTSTMEVVIDYDAVLLIGQNSVSLVVDV